MNKTNTKSIHNETDLCRVSCFTNPAKAPFPGQLWRTKKEATLYLQEQRGDEYKLLISREAANTIFFVVEVLHTRGKITSRSPWRWEVKLLKGEKLFKASFSKLSEWNEKLVKVK